MTTLIIEFGGDNVSRLPIEGSRMRPTVACACRYQTVDRSLIRTQTPDHNFNFLLQYDFQSSTQGQNGYQVRNNLQLVLFRSILTMIQIFGAAIPPGQSGKSIWIIRH